jgi:hypothetical protein
VFVVNQWLKRVPVAVVGELCIAGDAFASHLLGVITSSQHPPAQPFER